MTGRPGPNTRRLMIERGGFLSNYLMLGDVYFESGKADQAVEAFGRGMKEMATLVQTSVSETFGARWARLQ